MFGRRPDGRRVLQDDPILGFAPYLMPTRVDAQVHSVQRVDCDALTSYIREQRDKGNALSYMDLIIAAYVRVISQHPDMNRYIHNKRLYARNTICVSLALLKTFEDSNQIRETTIKLHFEPTATVYEVHDILHKAIEDNRKPEISNSTDKLARFVLEVPGLPTCIVGIARVLDRYGLMPRFLVNLSPFHTSMFLTNMMSLGMPHVNHHVYNFGNTSLFLAMGRTERTPVPGPGGTVTFKRILPIGVVSDERITSGAEFAKAFTFWRDLLAKPALLEMPPEEVKCDFPPEKMPSVIGRRQRKKMQLGA